MDDENLVNPMNLLIDLNDFTLNLSLYFALKKLFLQ